MNSEIIELIEKLDELISKDNAEIEFATFGETAIFGTENGYLRFGIELMKRAYEGRANGEAIEYLMRDTTDFYIDWLETDLNNFTSLRE